MDLETDVRTRLAKLGTAVPSAEPSLASIARRGRRRRVRAKAGIVFAVVAVSAAFLVPAYLLGGLAEDDTRPGSGGKATVSQPSEAAVVLPTDENGDVVVDAVLGSIFCSEGHGSGSAVGADGRDPIAICREVWTSQHVDVPHAMTACASGMGGVDVFDTADVGSCAQEGLPDIPPGYRDAARRFDAVTTGLEQRFPGGTCWQPAELMTAIRAALDAHGFDYWNVEDRTHADAPCASASVIDYAHLSYQVVDEPRPGHV